MDLTFREAKARLSSNALATPDGEMSALVRQKDWAQTPIGPMERWSPALRMMLDFLLVNRFPILLWWGPDYVSIYNDAYRPVLGTKHPQALGLPFREVWPEIAHIIGPLIDAPFAGGPATWMDDIELEIRRHGFTEETHFTIAYSPVPDDTVPSGIGGVIATVNEITDKVVGERRIAALRDLGAGTSEARTAEEACSLAAVALRSHNKDIPFALIYLLDVTGDRAQLVATARVPITEPAAEATIALGALRDPASIWPLAEVLDRKGPVTVEKLHTRVSSVPAGPWSDPPDTAIILPIRSSAAQQLAGFLVAGISPRLRLDQQYRSFLDLAAAQISTAITSARAYEEERKRAEALAAIDRAKTQFFSNVSHEFRTPLSLIIGPLTDALANDAGLERSQLELVHRNSLRLLKLVNSLLDFSRIEAGRARAIYAATDLPALTAELASNFRSACERAGLRFIVNCRPLSAPVYVDRDMWEQIVLNLLSNAFKFTFKGRIEVSLHEVAGCAQLSVHDTGVGIPESEIGNLFDRFHRIEGQRSRTHEGSGIGLALVLELVKLHGGTMQVKSTVDRGTIFIVRMPFGTPQLATEAHMQSVPTWPSARTDAFVQEALHWLPDESASATSGAGEEPEAAAGIRNGSRLLLADDNGDMRDYIRRLLANRCEVRSVADGGAALTSIRRQRPDLVLADVMMPGMDGFALLREIRGDPMLRDIPVILLSARAGEESRVEGLAAGANDYLVKPFSARELIARVSVNLELARIRSDAMAALRDSEERYRAMVRASTFVVYRMSADWTQMIELAGKGFIADTSQPSDHWLGDYIYPEDQPMVMGAIQKAIAEKSVFELEHRVRRVDGSLGWTHSRAVPILDENGEIREWFGAASNVTGQRGRSDAS